MIRARFRRPAEEGFSLGVDRLRESRIRPGIGPAYLRNILIALIESEKGEAKAQTCDRLLSTVVAIVLLDSCVRLR
jgi:hypothetical protein